MKCQKHSCLKRYFKLKNPKSTDLYEKVMPEKICNKY